MKTTKRRKVAVSTEGRVSTRRTSAEARREGRIADDVERRLDRFLRRQPVFGREAFVAPGAIVVGDVRLGNCASVWYNAVLRADINRIVVGDETNIQDGAVIHLADAHACRLGNRVTVGHGAIVHGCEVGDESLIGMGAVVLDGAVIGSRCLIGAKALVPPGMKVPSGVMVLGSPGRVVRKLTAQEHEYIVGAALKYVAIARYFREHRIGLASDG